MYNQKKITIILNKDICTSCDYIYIIFNLYKTFIMTDAEVTDYIRKEIIDISTLTKLESPFLDNIINMSNDDKKRLVHITEKLKKEGCLNSFVVAIEEFIPEIDNGGSARYMFLKSIQNIVDKPNNIINQLISSFREDADKENFIENNNKVREALKENYYDFLYDFASTLALEIIREIDCDKHLSDDTLRQWRLFSKDNKDNFIPIYNLVDESIDQGLL